MNKQKCLHHLAIAMRGRPIEEADWTGLIRESNEAFMTPDLYVASKKSGQLENYPDDVHDYLTLIHQMNVARNEALFMQLQELVYALNGAGIVPLLSKGAGELWRSGGATARMMFDLDLTISAAEIARTEECFLALGYTRLHGIGWARGQDAGSVDIHFPPGRYPEYWPSPELMTKELQLCSETGRQVFLYSPTLTASHIIIHDMIKDGRWWLATINLRALFELHQVISGQSVNWTVMREVLATRLARDCLASQVLALAHFFGSDLPEIEISTTALNHHERRLRQLGTGPLASAMAAYGSSRWSLQRFYTRFRNEAARAETFVSLRRRVLQSLRLF